MLKNVKDMQNKLAINLAIAYTITKKLITRLAKFTSYLNYDWS